MNLRFFAAASAALLAAGVSAGENLLYNSSFELGACGWDAGVRVVQAPSKNVFPPPAVAEASPAVHGKHCLKVSCLPEYLQSWPMVSPEVPLKAGKKYTVSFYAKAEKATKTTFSMHTNYLAYWNSASGYRSFDVGTEWKRYHFSFVYQPKGVFLRSGYNYHFLLVGLPDKSCAAVYFDAMQIEEGELTDYKPAGPVEYKVALPTMYLQDKNSISAEVTALAYEKSAPAKDVVVTDTERKREICRARTSFRLEPFVPQKKTVVLGNLPYGSFRAAVADAPATGAADFVRIRSNKAEYQPGKFALGVIDDQFGIGNESKNGFRYSREYSKDEAELSRLCGAVFVQYAVMGNFRKLSPKGRGQFELDRLELYFAAARKHKLKLEMNIAAQALYLHDNGKPTGNVPDWLAKLDRYGHPEGVVRGEWKQVHCVFPPVEVVGELAEAMAKRYKDEAFLFRLFPEANGYMPAAVLAEYAKEVYTRIKKVAPDMIVNSITPTEDKGVKMSGFFYEYLKAGGGKYTDMYAFHPYSATQDDSPLSAMDGIESFRNSMKFYQAERPLAELECIYLGTIPTGNYFEKETFPAVNLARRLLIDAGEGLILSSPVGFRQLHLPVPAVHHGSQWILRSPDARFAVHNAMGCLLNGGEDFRRVRLAGTTLCYAFRNHGTAYSAVWNVSGKSDMLLKLPPGVSCRVFDMFGNEIKTAKERLSLELDREPKIIKWSSNADVEAIHKTGRYVRHEIAMIHGVKCVNGGIAVQLTATSEQAFSGMIRIGSEYTGNVKRAFASLKPNEPSIVVIPCKIAPRAPAEFDLDVVVMGNEKVVGKKLQLRVNPVIKVGSKPQKFTMKDHSFTLRKDGNTLKITMFLKRDKVTAAKDPKSPWEGDCAEFFLDFAPGGSYNPQQTEKFTMDCVQIAVPAVKQGKAKFLCLPAGHDAHGASAVVRNAPGGVEVELTVPFTGDLGLTVHANAGGKTEVWRGKQNYANRNGFAVITEI